MAMTRPVYRDLLIAGAVQLLALLLSASILDMGGFASATTALSAVYWVGVFFILSRRSGALTRGDHLFIRFGLIPILAVGIPVLLHVWMMKKVI